MNSRCSNCGRPVKGGHNKRTCGATSPTPPPTPPTLPKTHTTCPATTDEAYTAEELGTWWMLLKPADPAPEKSVSELNDYYRNRANLLKRLIQLNYPASTPAVKHLIVSEPGEVKIILLNSADFPPPLSTAIADSLPANPPTLENPAPEEERIRQLSAENPYLPENIMHSCATLADPETVTLLASNLGLSAETTRLILNRCAKNPSQSAPQRTRDTVTEKTGRLDQKDTVLFTPARTYLVLKNLASNPFTNPETLRLIATKFFDCSSSMRDPSSAKGVTAERENHLQFLLAGNPNTPPDILDDMSSQTEPASMLSHIIRNPNTSEQTMRKIFHQHILPLDKTLAVNRKYVSFNPDKEDWKNSYAASSAAPEDTLILLAQHRPQSRHHIARNPHLTPNTAETLAENIDADTLYELVHNPATPHGLLTRFASSQFTDSRARRYLAHRPRLAAETLHVLAADPDRNIASVAAHRLTLIGDRAADETFLLTLGEETSFLVASWPQVEKDTVVKLVRRGKGLGLGYWTAEYAARRSPCLPVDELKRFVRESQKSDVYTPHSKLLWMREHHPELLSDERFLTLLH